MKMITTLVAFCVLIGFGWLFLNPTDEESGQSKRSQERTVHEIVEGSAPALYQRNTIEKELAVEPSTAFPNQSLSLGLNSDQPSFGNQELKTEILSTQTIEPERGNVKKKSAISNDYNIQGSPANNMVQSGPTQPGYDPDLTTSAPLKKEVLVGNSEPGALSDPVSNRPTEAATERYIERMQTAGTNASENLDRAARFLGQ